MGKFRNLIVTAFCFICLLSNMPTVLAEETEVLVSEDFSGNSIPEGFCYSEENGTSLNVEDGKIRYKRPNNINATGGFWYNLSELGSLTQQHCNKLVFEYDVSYEVIRNDTYCSFVNTPVIFDNAENKYLDTYIEVKNSSEIQFVSAQGWTKMPFKPWNMSDSDKDVYYKTRLTIDIAKSKQTLEIAEMEVGRTSEPQYKSFGTKDFYQVVDGSLARIDFIRATAWRNATISIDNFKITKEELWEKMEIVSVTPEKGSEFKSNKPEMTVEFTNVVDSESLSSIVLEDEDGNVVKTDITVSGNKVIIVPKGYLSYSAVYYLKIGEGIKDTAGQELLKGAIYSFSTMPDPTDRNGTIFLKDTFGSDETIEEYSWTEDGATTVVIEDGMLKYEHKTGKQVAASIGRKLNIAKDTAEKVVFEYDLYPINIRHDKTTTYEFEFPGVFDDAGNKYCDFYIQPVSDASTVCRLILRSGSILDAEFKTGTDYMYHVTLVMDMTMGKYSATFEENSLIDGSVRIINCPWTSFFSTDVNGNLSELRFAGGSTWGYSTFEFDNLVCYSPEDIEFEGANIKDGAEDVKARSSIELSFTNPLALGWEKAITVVDNEENIKECKMTLKNGGRTVNIESVNGRFEYLTSYTVKVEKDIISDVFGQILTEENFISFKTGDVPPAKITFHNFPEYKLSDEEGNEVLDITNAKKVVAELKGAENVSEDEDSERMVTLIAGIYDEKGNLRKYASEEMSLKKGDKVDLTAEIIIDDNVMEGYSVKVYVWDGIPGAPYSVKE